MARLRKHVVVVGVSIALGALLGACGGSTKEKSQWFLPRSALDSLVEKGRDLPAGMRLKGSHDSGVIVEADSELNGMLTRLHPDAFVLGGAGERREFSAFGFDSMQAKLKELASRYPQLATLSTYGTSREGRPEYVLTITGHAKERSEANKPELMLTGATHGNEIVTVDVILALAEKLLSGYGTDPRFTAMVDGHVLYFIPAVCVDSYVAETRYNDGEDPNRVYPFPDDPNRQPVDAIRDVIAFFHSRNIAGSMDFHAAASMIMYPWAYTYDDIDSRDRDRLEELTARMAETNGFAHGPIASTIYVAAGSSADYYYWKHRTQALAIEVSHNKASSDPKAPEAIIQENLQSTWLFIESFKSP